MNNAGLVMSKRQETTDGFEMHFGVNHLGKYFSIISSAGYLLNIYQKVSVMLRSTNHDS